MIKKCAETQWKRLSGKGKKKGRQGKKRKGYVNYTERIRGGVLSLLVDVSNHGV